MSHKEESSGQIPDEAKAKDIDTPHEALRPLKTETHIQRLQTHCMLTCSNLQSKKIKSFWSNNLVQVFSSKLLTGHREREICLFYPTQGTKKTMT